MKKIILLTVLCITCTSCKLGRFVYYNYANITDHKIFPSRTIEKPETPFIFQNTKKSFVQDSISLTYEDRKETIAFEDYLITNKTVAYVVIKNDTILYEKYFNKYEENSIVNSFSIAKSILSMLVGIAIDEGKIKSTKEPITNYIPELKDERLKKVTIEQLLNMTSGIAFDESYTNPFGDAATFYYGTNLTKAVHNMELEYAPRTRFKYSSGDSQVLGLVLASALKEVTISEYLETKIWKPLGMEYDASWSLDKKKNGVEKTFCCLHARARDFAKLGRLYLNKGNWNGTQIVSKKWVENSTKIDSTGGNVSYYQYQWWINEKDNSYEAEGILGQHIYVHPEKNVIIVRLGEKVGKTGGWTQVAQGIAAKL